MTTHEGRTQHDDPQFTDPQYADPQSAGQQYPGGQPAGQQYPDQQYPYQQYPAGQYPPQQQQYPDAQVAPGLAGNDSPFDDAPARGDSTPMPEEISTAQVAEPPQATPSTGGHTATSTDTSTDTEVSLFGETEMSGFRARWNDVQAGFVDDPKQCVQTADALVSEVVDQLTRGFAETRSRMEAQWSRGEDASTEDLRLALKNYRDFFQRLLSV